MKKRFWVFLASAVLLCSAVPGAAAWEPVSSHTEESYPVNQLDYGYIHCEYPYDLRVGLDSDVEGALAFFYPDPQESVPVYDGKVYLDPSPGADFSSLEKIREYVASGRLDPYLSRHLDISQGYETVEEKPLPDGTGMGYRFRAGGRLAQAHLTLDDAACIFSVRMLAGDPEDAPDGGKVFIIGLTEGKAGSFEDMRKLLDGKAYQGIPFSQLFGADSESGAYRGGRYECMALYTQTEGFQAACYLPRDAAVGVAVFAVSPVGPARESNALDAAQCIVNTLELSQGSAYQLFSCLAYTVRDGDCLYDIARDYTGDGRRYASLAAYNRLENPDLIYTGQRIIIPPRLLSGWWKQAVKKPFLTASRGAAE